MTRPGCMTTATVVRERTFCGLTKIDFGWRNQSIAIQITDDRARRPADASLADRVGTSGSPDHWRRKTCGSDAQYGQDQRHYIGDVRALTRRMPMPPLDMAGAPRPVP